MTAFEVSSGIGGGAIGGDTGPWRSPGRWYNCYWLKVQHHDIKNGLFCTYIAHCDRWILDWCLHNNCPANSRASPSAGPVCRSSRTYKMTQCSTFFFHEQRKYYSCWHGCEREDSAGVGSASGVVQGESTSNHVLCLTCISGFLQTFWLVSLSFHTHHLSIIFAHWNIWASPLIWYTNEIVPQKSHCNLSHFACRSANRLKCHILDAMSMAQLKRIVAVVSSLLSQQCLLLCRQQLRFYSSSTFVLSSKSPLLPSWRAFTAGRWPWV